MISSTSTAIVILVILTVTATKWMVVKTCFCICLWCVFLCVLNNFLFKLLSHEHTSKTREIQFWWFSSIYDKKSYWITLIKQHANIVLCLCPARPSCFSYSNMLSILHFAVFHTFEISKKHIFLDCWLGLSVFTQTTTTKPCENCPFYFNRSRLNFPFYILRTVFQSPSDICSNGCRNIRCLALRPNFYSANKMQIIWEKIQTCPTKLKFL